MTIYLPTIYSVLSSLPSLYTDGRMNEHVTPALRQLHWLPVDRSDAFKLCNTMHSIHTGQCPMYSSYMVRAVAVNQMRSGLQFADSVQYMTSCCRTEIGKRAFSYAGPLVWNDLPPSTASLTRNVLRNI